MADNRNCQPCGPHGRETVCIDCNRILDSCKDKDCFPDARVYLTEYGQELIEKCAAIRVKCTKIVGVNIDTEPVQFNRGFYQVLIRFYVKLVFECCVNVGRPQEFEGIVVCDKKVILYGSEGNVNIFKSCPSCDFCCPAPEGSATTNLPTVVVETVDPIALSVCTATKHCSPCSCGVGDIPDNVAAFVGGCLTDGYEGCKRLYVTLGFFSVIRIERPGQYLIQATEYSVPEKECSPCDEEDPCALFERMAFPVNEFSPPPYKC
ncbi:MAG: hypothetical protein IJD10_04380 [Clostridia bacterium]|nr:hypothetical protein [Clostridia bacterium]